MTCPEGVRAFNVSEANRIGARLNIERPDPIGEEGESGFAAENQDVLARQHINVALEAHGVDR